MLNIFASNADQPMAIYRAFQAVYNLPSSILPIIEPGRKRLSIIGVYPEDIQSRIEAGLEEFTKLLEIITDLPIVVSFAFIKVQFEVNPEEAE